MVMEDGTFVDEFSSLQSGYPITIIPPLMRSTYISAIRQANKGNVTPFLDLFLKWCMKVLRSIYD